MEDNFEAKCQELLTFFQQEIQMLSFQLPRIDRQSQSEMLHQYGLRIKQDISLARNYINVCQEVEEQCRHNIQSLSFADSSFKVAKKKFYDKRKCKSGNEPTYDLCSILQFSVF